MLVPRSGIYINPDDAGFYNNLGKALSDKWDHDQAIESYQKAININPEHAGSYNNLGLVYLAQGGRTLAKGFFEKGLELNQKDKFLHMNCGHCLLAEKQREEAMYHYQHSRDGFEDKTEFFRGMEADYIDCKLAQYSIPRNEYFALIQQLKDEINDTA